MGCFPVPHPPDTKTKHADAPSSLSHSSSCESESPNTDQVGSTASVGCIPSSSPARRPTLPRRLYRSRSTNAGSIDIRGSGTRISSKQHQQHSIDIGCSAPRFRALASHTLKHSHKTMTASDSLRRASSYYRHNMKQSAASGLYLSSSSTMTAYGHHGQESSREIFHSAPLSAAESISDQEPKPSIRVFFPLPLPPSPASQTTDDSPSQSLSSTTTSKSSCSSSSSPNKVHTDHHFSSNKINNCTTVTSRSSSLQNPNLQSNHQPLPLPLPLPPDILPLREFTFDELAGACQNFATEFYIRDGGIGPVFRAMLRNDLQGEGSSEVAVTKLIGSHTQSFKKWRGMVDFLACLSHPNLTRFLGFTGEDPATAGLDHKGSGLRKDRYFGQQRDRLLVFEHTSNGSLDNLLYCRDGRAPLDWAKRLKIAAGAADGLAFLHERMPKQVIYKVFKTSNIQVDDGFNAKLSDFGFTTCCKETSICTETRMAEDAYAAPETLVSPSGEASAKSHIWSFGVVLLELLTGRQNKDTLFPPEERNLVEWCRPYLLDSKKLYLVMDPELKGRYPTRTAKTVADLALLCLTDDPTARPSMKNVAGVLSSQIKQQHRASHGHTMDSKVKQYTHSFSGSAVGMFDRHSYERSTSEEREGLKLSKSHGLPRSGNSLQGYGRWRGSARQRGVQSRALMDRFLWSGEQVMRKGSGPASYRHVFLSGEATS